MASARRQHGVLTHSHLRDFGLASSTIRERVRAGRLHPIHRGVYAVGRPDLPIEGKWMAAVLACGEGAALSHRSAAALHGLLRDNRTAIDVTLPRRSGRSHAGIRIHRPREFAAAERTSVDGIPCMSVARTLLDLAAVVHRRLLERACNQAEVLQVFDMDAMAEVIARSPRTRGVRTLRAVLGNGRLGEDMPRSALEERFLRLCMRAGLPKPRVNAWVTLSSGDPIQVDFLWPEHRLIVETDGFRTHRTRQAFGRDRRRDRLLRIDGWQPARFTREDVVNQSADVIEQLRRLTSFRAEFRRPG